MSDLDTVEDLFYKRMIRSAFVGFVKSAVLAAAIGGIIAGGLFFGSAIIGIHLLPAALLGGSFLHACTVGALTCIIPAGAFGATSGINSARDARQFLLHAKPAHGAGQGGESPEQVVQEAHELSGTVNQHPTPKAEPKGNWLEKVKSSELYIDAVPEKSLGRN